MLSLPAGSPAARQALTVGQRPQRSLRKDRSSAATPSCASTAPVSRSRGHTTRPPLGTVDGDDLDRIYYYTIFPSLLLSLHPDYVMVHYARPIAPDRTEVVCAWLFDPQTMEQPRLRSQRRRRFLGSHQPAGLARERAHAARPHIARLLARPLFQRRRTVGRVRPPLPARDGRRGALITLGAALRRRPGDCRRCTRLAWRNIGPAVAGGRTAGVAGTDADPYLYYFGGADGGVWKTTNGGLTWQSVWPQKRAGAIGALAIDPNDRNVVWAGTGEPNLRNDVSYGDGVWLTRDGGAHWRNVGLRRDVGHRARSWSIPRDSRRVLVAAVGNPYRDSSAARRLSHDRRRTQRGRRTLYLGPSSGASDIAMDAARSERRLRRDLAVPARAVELHQRRPARRHLQVDRRRRDAGIVSAGNGLPGGRHGPHRHRRRGNARVRADPVEGRRPVALRRRRRAWR